MRAHLQHRTGLASAKLRHAKARVKEARIMRPEFANARIIGAHLGGISLWHSDKFTACQNVEFIRIQHQPTSDQISLCQPFPKRIDRTAARGVDVDETSMFARAPSDHSAFLIRQQIDTQPHPIAYIRRLAAMHQTSGLLQLLHGIVGNHSRSTAKAQL